MMGSSGKTVCLVLSLLIVVCAGLYAFDWPQEYASEDAVKMRFGELREGVYNSSLIFQDQGEVVSIEAGTVLLVMGSESQEMGWLNSPLGRTVIVAHYDSLLSVYGNLREVSLDKAAQRVGKGELLGVSGMSGWQDGQSGLELQVVDTERQVFINPLILMPKSGKDAGVVVPRVSAISRTGGAVDLRTRKRVPEGTYSLYMESQEGFFPYTTVVSVNGAAVDTISFAAMERNVRRLCVSGKKFYEVSALYPVLGKQFLADLTLPQGKSTITVTMLGIDGAERSVSYTLDVW